MILPFPLDVSIFMFFVYGLVGWIVEVIYYGITEGRFINRGFCNGPICPVYGIGFYCVIWLFRPFLRNFPMLFFGSAIICTIVELLAGVILYTIFHLRWWDYSDYRLNFKGFICVRFSIYWGIACSLGMYMLHPAVMKFASLMPKYVLWSFDVINLALLIVDIIVTVTAIIGFNKKVRFLSSVSGGIRKYSDKIGSSIYGTVDAVKTRTDSAIEITQSDYAEFRKVFAAHRKAELELSQKNLAEERRLLMKYAVEGKNGIVNTSKAAVEAVKLRLPEINLAKRIAFVSSDKDASSIRILKQHYSVIEEEVFGENKEEEVNSDNKEDIKEA